MVSVAIPKSDWLARVWPPYSLQRIRFWSSLDAQALSGPGSQKTPQSVLSTRDGSSHLPASVMQEKHKQDEQ
jgi:hypothetical protein